MFRVENEEFNLRPKDGKIHILFVANNFMPKNAESQSTERINTIIEGMQDKGYEIVDIKLAKGSGIDCTTLITYK